LIVEPTAAPKKHGPPEANGGAARGAAQQSSGIFQQLIKHTGIDPSQLNGSPNSDELYGIAREQGHEWEQCAVKLGLKDQEINDIKVNDRHDVLEQRHKALVQWKQHGTFMATYKQLVEVFIDVRRNDLAQYVCKLVKK